MQLAVLVIFLAAALTPWLFYVHKARASIIVAIVPAALTVWFASHLGIVAGGEVVTHSYAWIPSMGISLTMVLDGLSLLFALLICGIGTFIVLYAGSYLKEHPDLSRFLVIMMLFMGSMLGLVLADNLITLFVFWELTSITSYLLIGFKHTSESARKAALQGLFVTVGGGLALLAGLIMLGGVAGTYSIQEILNADLNIAQHSLYTGLLICILLGTFTKSAQFPFHFWLPNAMAAPTPVSAYLHSATMVKAGVYLMARLHPELGGTELWFTLLTTFGALTMFTGAFMAIRATDFKKLLAYSTVMALGTLTLLLGIGTETAMLAFGAYLLGHSLYKGALFMLAGIVDHEAGGRDVTALGGLRALLPITAITTLIAALSLAGLPPLFGFIGKELLLEALIGSGVHAVLFALVLAAAVLVVAVAAIIAIRPFYGAFKAPKERTEIHEAPKLMLAGPVVLTLLSLVAGILPYFAGVWLTIPASSAVQGSLVEGYLAIWHGFNLPLLLSAISLTLGAVMFWKWDMVRNQLQKLNPIIERGPESGYFAFMKGLVFVAEWQTRLLQNGSMRNYLRTILIVFTVITGYTLLVRYQLHWTWSLDIRLHELIGIAVLLGAAGTICLTHSRLGAVASMGVVGFSVALMFVFFSAPDLSITQILVETLTVILLVLVLFRLPSFSNISTKSERISDAFIAIFTGVLFMFLIMITVDVQLFEPISGYMAQNSQPLAYGRNIVNVILVDFRALDTLGELFVLAAAALGVHAMIKFNPSTAPGSNHFAGTLVLPPKNVPEKDIVHSIDEIHQRMLEKQNILSSSHDEDEDEEENKTARQEGKPS